MNIMQSIREFMEHQKALIQAFYDSIPETIKPEQRQNEIMALISQASGLAIVHDKGTAFKVLGAKLLFSHGCFVQKELIGTAKDVVILHTNANDAYWFSVLFHELAHSTGTASRLNRSTLGHAKRTIEQHCFEEVLAESVARRIMERLELATEKTRDVSNKYIDGYASKLDYKIDYDLLQNQVEQAETMVMSWIESIDFKNTLKIG